MRKITAVLVLFLSSLVFASESRVTEIVSQFNKTKQKSKEKFGVVKQLYVEVRSEPVLQSNPRAYTGFYAVQGLDLALQLDVAANGAATGTGVEQGRTFTLRNGRVEGALLTATKVYRNGATAPFEGAFLRQRVREGTTPQRINSERTEWGLGVTGLNLRVDSIHLTKLFYRADR